MILIDQLREIWIDSELEVVDTTVYYNRVFKKDYSIGLNLTGNSVDDPDQNFYENLDHSGNHAVPTALEPRGPCGSTRPMATMRFG